VNGKKKRSLCSTPALLVKKYRCTNIRKNGELEIAVPNEFQGSDCLRKVKGKKEGLVQRKETKEKD